jgi:hypothetical protein
MSDECESVVCGYWNVADTPKSLTSPSDKHSARDAARKGDKVRQHAIAKAMRAGWSDEDADEANWLAEAAAAYPGPEAAVYVLYGHMRRLILELSNVTGETQEAILSRVVR